MPRIAVVHWRIAEAGSLLSILKAQGHDVAHAGDDALKAIRYVRENQPDAVVIDLSRLPSHGREIATELRRSTKTRHIPLVFCGGEPEKTEKVRDALPDAHFTPPERLAAALKKALKNPPIAPVLPVPMMERYSGRSAAQKLSICAGAKVAVLEPPRDYAQAIGDLPENVEYKEDTTSGCSVVLWFANSVEEFESRIARRAQIASRAKLWILWKKGGSTAKGELTENLIREGGIAAGLVDYKVCSVNQRWSALLFAAQKPLGRASGDGAKSGSLCEDVKTE